MNKKESKNPFVAGLTVNAVKVYSKDKFFLQDEWIQDDGIKLPVDGFINESEFTYSFYADVFNSTKVRKNEEVMKKLMLLPERGCKLFCYVIQKLGKDSDLVELKREHYMKFADVSGRTFYSALSDLVTAGFITRYKNNKYWINPAYFFNGNRITKYPDNVKVVAKIMANKNA